jgi:hypothetical protein
MDTSPGRYTMGILTGHSKMGLTWTLQYGYLTCKSQNESDPDIIDRVG